MNFESNQGHLLQSQMHRSRVRASLPAEFFWYGRLASPSLQIASVGSEHHGKNNGGPNQWIIRVKVTPR